MSLDFELNFSGGSDGNDLLNPNALQLMHIFREMSAEYGGSQIGYFWILPQNTQ